MKIFIPIKEKSQRVPNKNFRLFAGQPLWRHTVSKFCKNHEVYIDTDSERLIEAIKSDSDLCDKVTVYKRKESLLGHNTPVIDLIYSFVEKFSIKEPIAQIHVTSPFLSEETLSSAFTAMRNHDSVVSCNIHNSRFWRKESYGMCPINHNPIKLEQTQDLPVLYEENSCFYIFNPEVIKYGNRIGKTPLFYPTDQLESQDIDTEKDWEAAIRLLERKQ